MLIRLVLKNIYSFKEQTEFNLYPNKCQRLLHHKRSFNGVDFLRMSAIYGANGSGKSNMIKAVANLEKYILDGKVPKSVTNMRFKLSSDNQHLPISIGIEFLADGKIYYYTITFEDELILNESLVESKKTEDILIFERNNQNGKQSIEFFESYMKNEKNKLFVEVLAEKLIQKHELLLSFLYSKYRDEFADIISVWDWFNSTLVVISPDAAPGSMAHILNRDPDLMDFANGFLPTLNTGINKLEVRKDRLEDLLKDSDSKLKDLIENHKKNPNKVTILAETETGDEVAVANEGGEVSMLRLASKHLNDIGEEIDFKISMESDGTRRLIEYIPAISDIINTEGVWLIDEIERSIHPKTIKEIISKISLDESAKGQLVFTTHESCLLDQDILRPDEIWFAQKSLDGASNLYPLSDFNIHHTANIENGYLNGRFGGIPFLSSLQDLNWH